MQILQVFLAAGQGIAWLQISHATTRHLLTSTDLIIFDYAYLMLAFRNSSLTLHDPRPQIFRHIRFIFCENKSSSAVCNNGL